MLEFIKDQVDAGVKPQKIPVGIGEMDREFANRKFAVMIEGSWMPGAWSNLTRQQVDNIGFIPMFPVPDNKTSTSTLMGGWQFNIPVTSSHKGIAWEVIVNMLKPEVSVIYEGRSRPSISRISNHCRSCETGIR